jgi:putative membrane-bound dehydrogenase-like protein
MACLSEAAASAKLQIVKFILAFLLIAIASNDLRAQPRLILVTQSKEFVHDVVKRGKDGSPNRVERTFDELAKKTNLFTLETTDDTTTLTPEKLKDTRAIVFYTTGDLPFTPQSYAAFEKWINDGGSFFGIHCATDTLHHNPDFIKLIGGEFDGHPWNADKTVTIKSDDDANPAAKPFVGGWTRQEEIYEFKNFDPATVRVLLSLDMEKTELKKPRLTPVAWCKTVGKGKVFYTSLGHRDDVWTSDVYQQHLIAAIRWLLNLDQWDVTPNPEVSKREEEIAKKVAPAEEPASQPQSMLPTAPPGFELTTFVKAPEIHSPVSLAATPDGRVFVAEDEYNSQPSRDQGLSRVKLCVDTNGDGVADKVTVFADKLNSPQGMCWSHGTLYVVHAPFLTAFRDRDGDGVADEREDLIKGLGPVPEGLVHHVPSGIHLAIDGWLYIAIGDKGIAQAIGKDGRRVHLHGGGIVRVRPDGTEMELFCSGTRNIFDVAIDPYLNMFTRDNTNDGDGWNSRLTQMQRGGQYGYPTLFRNFGDEIIQPLDDYGSGGATGSIYVHEPGFPADLGDCLYTTDWAKSTVYRHKLSATGATFKPTQEEFVKNCFATHEDVDGLSRMYIADWARRDWGNNTTSGAVYVLRAAKSSATQPTTAPTTQAYSDFPNMQKATQDELLEHLASFSAIRRREAQQEILSRGNTPAMDAALKKLMLATDRPLYVRVAALFTLAQLMGPSANPSLVDASTDPTLREFAFRAMVDRESMVQSLKSQVFVTALKDSNPRVREQAAIGIGYIGDASLGSNLVLLTADSDPTVRHAAQQALRRLKSSAACVAALSPATSPDVVAGALRTLRAMYESRVVSAISSYLTIERRVLPRREAVKALSRLYQKEAAWDGKWWMTRPDTRGPNYKGASWEGSSQVAATLLKLLNDPDVETQKLAVMYTGLARMTEAAPMLARIALAPGAKVASPKDPADALRISAAQALIDIRTASTDVLEALQQIATSDRFEPELRGKAASAFGGIEGPEARTALIRLLTALDASKTAPTIVVEKAAEGFGSRSAGADDLSAVMAMLKSAQQHSTRLAAAAAMLRSTDKAVVDAVAKLWTSATHDQLEAMLGAVAQVPAESAKQYQSRAKAHLQDSDELVRHAALQAIAVGADSAVVEDLLKSAARMPADRVAIASALAQISPSKADEKQIEPVAQLLVSAVPILSRNGERETYGKVLGAAQKFLDDKRMPVEEASKLRSQLKQTGVIYAYQRTDPIPVADSAKTFSAVFPPEQSPTGPFAAFSVDGKAYDWKPIEVKDARGVQRLNMPSSSVVYLTSTIDSAAACTAVLSCGSDDGIQVWLNGQQVIKSDVDRGARPDVDSATVQLNAGTNVLLVKVNNHTDGSGVEVRVRSRPPEFDVNELVDVTEKLPSNPDRGKQLFGTLGCIKCHTTDQHDEPKGPFLGDVGSKFDVKYLAESVMHPNAKIAQGFGTTSVTARDESGKGATEVQGFIVRESGDELQMRDLTGKMTTLPKARIARRLAVPGSMMPEGLADALTLEDFRALMSYLVSLKVTK